MVIEWEKAQPGLQLDELSKSLVREIAENFLANGTGLPDWEKKVALGTNYRLLDNLMQTDFAMNIAGRYYPRLAALYYLSPAERSRCEEATTLVLKAFQSLCKARRAGTFSLVEVSDEINRLAPRPVGLHAARIGMQFARDFTNYFGNFENSTDTPATAATVWQSILEFEDLGQAWQEELLRRHPPLVRTSPVSVATQKESADTSIDRARRVFVIHGRDERLRVGIFTLLGALHLEPLEWTRAIGLTGKASPYIGEILDAAFKYAQAVVVLLTPDDEARLRNDLLQPHDPEHERVLTGQPRPNVLFEAGMAFASHPDQTVLVQFGQIRPFSDIAGRHVVKMDNSVPKRQELAVKLRTAGCAVDMDGTDWQSVGDLKPPPEATTLVPSEDARPARQDSKPAAPESRLNSSKRILIAPVSRTTSDNEYTLEKVDETGAVIRLPNGVLVRVPKVDYIESWDDAMQKPKLILTRKYFQGYFPGHENAEEYFLPR